MQFPAMFILIGRIYRAHQNFILCRGKTKGTNQATMLQASAIITTNFAILCNRIFKEDNQSLICQCWGKDGRQIESLAMPGYNSEKKHLSNTNLTPPEAHN